MSNNSWRWHGGSLMVVESLMLLKQFCQYDWLLIKHHSSPFPALMDQLPKIGVVEEWAEKEIY